MFTVTAGPAAVLDTDGNAICHAPRQTRSALNAPRRRMVVSQWEEALTLAGLMTGNMVKCAEDGVWRDRGRGIDNRDGYADFAHIVADSLDGAFCMCNAVPVEGSVNREDGDARPSMDGWTFTDRRAFVAAVRDVAIRNMTKTKRARLAG